MAFLNPPDTPEVVYEFFAPFAHVPGKYEWCRIRSPTHGAFDCFILLSPGDTARPATVYVNHDAGQRYMADRYPECATLRLPTDGLRIEETPDGRTVTGRLESSGQGPVKRAQMSIAARPNDTPQCVAYGGQGRPVWGGRFTCWGVDLVLAARAEGVVAFRDGRLDPLQKSPAIVTLGSFARIAPLAKAAP